MSQQLRVKKSSLLPGIVARVDSSGQTTFSTLNQGAELQAFEQFVDEHGNTWMRLGPYGIIGGSIDGTWIPTSSRPFRVDDFGNVYVLNAPGTVLTANTESTRVTYSAAINAHAPAATPTDWFTILGSANKVIRVIAVSAALRATAASQYRVSIAKYSTAYAGGTSAAVTAVAHDSRDPAAVATVLTWAGGLPTVGTLVGRLTDDSLPVSVLGTPTFDNEPSGVLYDFGVRNSKPIVLRGAAEYLALNSAAAALPAGMVADVRIQWTEDVA